MPKPHSAEELRSKNRDYADAAAPCDIVLKGGAASGFVYSGVALELAKTYRLQSIGGTSAGAGAAGVFAAAEYGRRSRNPQAWGYAGIDHVAGWAGEKTADGWTRLRHLFGPDPETARLFNVLASVFPLRKRGWLTAIFIAARGYGGLTFIGIAIAVLLAGLVLWSAAPGVGVGTFVLVAVLGFAAAALFVSILVALGIWADVKRMPANGFALCSAMSEPAGADPRPERMTGWLYGLYQELAGKPLDSPLTFGDLWGLQDPATGQGIRLSLMTVNLTLGRPVRVTCDAEHRQLERGEQYWFDPQEFARLFPRKVVEAMEAAAGAAPDGGATSRRLPFPETPRVPIVVGVRMSFALPVLFSAVPLYKRDETRMPVERRAAAPAAEGALERCWFADGAVCSNLPIHLFDKPLPRWPTFALNLRRRHPDIDAAQTGDLAVWMDHEFADPNAERGWLREWWTRIERDPVPRDPAAWTEVAPIDQLKRYLSTTLNTGLWWADQEQLRLSTSRDRVAHVCLAAEEGSFNFDMKPEAIARLAELGREAGRKLAERFAEKAPGWPAHRGMRYLAAVQLAVRFIDDFESGYSHARHPDEVRAAVEAELRSAGLLGRDGDGNLKPEQIDTIVRLTDVLLAEEKRVPEPDRPGWPSHAKLKPDFAMRLMPES